jgi:hypothetical protein
MSIMTITILIDQDTAYDIDALKSDLADVVSRHVITAEPNAGAWAIMATPAVAACCCRSCDKSFDAAEELNAHMNSEHPDD